MAGCYGNSKEDRARERELFSYLAKQDSWEEKVNNIQSTIWMDLTDQSKVEGLVNGYELLLGKLPEIVRHIAEAHFTACVWQPERKDRLAALGVDILRMLEDEIEQLAIRMAEEE